MASVQSRKSCEESCQQHSPLGQKVSELFKGHHHSDNHNSSATQCRTQGQCHGRSRKDHKKNLFQKIKDGLSGHSSDSSGSSSESDSDNENRHKRKN